MTLRRSQPPAETLFTDTLHNDHPPHMKTPRTHAFTLPEAILTIAIIGILTTLVITSISNINGDAARMVARQQQAAAQSAANAWAASQMRDTTTGQIRSVEDIRADYNSRGHSLGRLNLIAAYLDDSTANHFIEYTTNTGRIKSEALEKARLHLVLDIWGATSYPKVELNAD